MGTASLVFGLILIGAGVASAYNFLASPSFYTGPDDAAALLLGFLIIVAPLMALGGILLRKYDNDKKKENEPIQYKKSEWSPKKSPILKGVIIGIIASLIIWGVSYAATYQTFVMTSDAMEPTIMQGDITRYSKSPFSQISVNDIIAFTDQDDSSRVLLNKVVRVYNDVVEVRNEESSTVRIVTEDQYIGKINSIEAVSGLLSVLLIPYLIFFLMAVAFVIPIIIMKIREKKI